MATYYIDFVGGNDASDGQSTGTALKTIPGSRNVANNAYVSTSWSSGATLIDSSHKVQPGTTFRIKPGTTWSSTYGGMIWITATYYVGCPAGTPTTFDAYQAWPSASGTVTFDGTGVTLGGTTGWGLIHVTVGGLAFTGEVYHGITIQNSPWCGISFYYASDVVGPNCDHMYLYNNHTACPNTATGIAEGNFYIYQGVGGSLTYVDINGNGQISNGFCTGEAGVSWTGHDVSYCTAYNHYVGLTKNSSCGVGFKAQNSQITWTNCVSHDNYRGWDPGEASAAGAATDIIYKIIDCTAYNNIQKGFSVNGPGYRPYYGQVNLYVINCVAYGNGAGDTGGNGFNCYAGPYNAYFINCIADSNGGYNGGSCNYACWEYQSPTDGFPSNLFIYNCIGYKPVTETDTYQANINILTFHQTTGYGGLSIDSDYNDWVTSGSDTFCWWDFDNSEAGQVQFSYAQIPTDWYNWYGASITPPAQGTGHYHCDAHSVATSPPWKNQLGHNYSLTAHLLGLNISGKPWYISEMGLDFNGTPRTSWDMGAYEYGTVPPGIYISVLK